MLVEELLPVATVEKAGLMSASDKKYNLTKVKASNYTFYKILALGNWERGHAFIYGDINGRPYAVFVGSYNDIPSQSFNINWILYENNHVKFYKKGYEIYVFFDSQENSPHAAFIQSSHGVTFVSEGSFPGSDYTEITT